MLWDIGRSPLALAVTEVLGFDTVTMACIVWLTLTRVFDTESVAVNAVLPTESAAELTSNVAPHECERKHLHPTQA